MLRKTKLFLALALTLTLCFTSITVALAEDEPTTTLPPAVETSQAAITKLLQVPVGTTVPTAMFLFGVTAYSVDSSAKNYSYDELTQKYNMPLIGGTVVDSDAGLTYDGSLKDGFGYIHIRFSDTAKYQKTETVNGITSYYLESKPLFDVAEFPHAGAYTYKITELANTYPISGAQQNALTYIGNHEALTYSGAQYTVTVYVIDNGGGDKEITFIGVTKDKDDDNTVIEDTAKVKVDPTPGATTGNPGGGDDGTGNNNGNNSHEYSDMIFTNKYMKTNGITTPNRPDPADPTNPDDPDEPDPNYAADSTLDISKIVDGDYGSHTTYFKFTLKLTVPSLIPGFVTGPYKAYIAESTSGDPGTYAIIKNGEGTNNKAESGTNYINFTSGTPKNFELKHGQKLIFVDTPVGSSYTLDETGTTGYLANASVTHNGGQPNATTFTSIGAAYALPNATILADDLYIGEGVNSAAITNDASSITPTGLNVNDLPFIGLISLALVSLAVFIILKIRQSKSYN